MQILRPTKKDREEIRELFQTVLIDTFQKDGIPEAYDGEISKSVARKMRDLEDDFDSNGTKEYFLVARVEKQIVGIIGFGVPNTEIKKNYTIDYTRIPEIKSSFILPDFQGQGIGTALYNQLLQMLKKRNFTEFVLDSGFAYGQIFWKHKLGEPKIIKKNFWGDGTDYMIWHKKLDEL